MASTDVTDVLSVDAKIAALTGSESSSEIWRALFGNTPEAIAAAALKASLSGGGGSPVAGAIIGVAGVNIAGENTYDLEWSYARDNPWDASVIPEIPDGLGLAVLLDGSSNVIETSEQGAWSFTYAVTMTGSSSDYVGEFRDGLSDVSNIRLPAPSGEVRTLVVCETFYLPQGAQLAPQIITESSTGTALASVSVNIVRIG